MRKHQKIIVAICILFIATVASGIGLMVIASENMAVADVNSHEDIEKCCSYSFCLHIFIQEIDLSSLEIGVLTDEVYLGDGVWVTRTITISDSPVILRDTEYAVPFWMCCNWPNLVFMSSTFCACSGNNMAGCTSFTRHEFQICLNCHSIRPGNTTTLPGCFYAFYSELGWRYPLNHVRDRRISEVNGGFGDPRDGGDRQHLGIDIVRERADGGGAEVGAIHGERVFAVHTGSVVQSGDHPDMGYHIAIRSNIRDPISNKYIISRYIHLSANPRVPVAVPSGTINVWQGNHIGYVGNTGNTNSSGHLHIEFNASGNPTVGGALMLNPQRFFAHINFTGNTRRLPHINN